MNNTVNLDVPATTAERLLAAEEKLKYFKYDHLPPAMQMVSKPFGELAQLLVEKVPRCSQRTIALQKLIEAKDAAVRATLP